MDAEIVKNILVEIAAGRSNAAAGRAAGCDRRTVRRYRRLVRALGLPSAAIDAFDGEELRRIFNARLPRHDEPDFAALAAEFPGATARLRYERYRERRQAAGLTAMSVSQFNRRRAEHDVLEYGIARFASPMPKPSTGRAEWGFS